MLTSTTNLGGAQGHTLTKHNNKKTGHETVVASWSEHNYSTPHIPNAHPITYFFTLSKNCTKYKAVFPKDIS
jgi:hypothetical protein